MKAPLSTVWRKETQHKGIWRENGKCVRCQMNGRDILCRFCLEPMCAPCASIHQTADHLRDLYIERLAQGKIRWDTAGRDEQYEAMRLRQRWEEEESEESGGDANDAVEDAPAGSAIVEADACEVPPAE